MMKKLIMLGMSMTIGLLSNILFNSCGNPLAWDNLDKEVYWVQFKNDSRFDIMIQIGEANLEKYEIKAKSVKSIKISDATKKHPDFLFKQRRNWREEFNIYVNGELKKRWVGPPKEMGTFNNFFHYNSWEVKKTPKQQGKNIVGEVTFTITDEDLK